MRYKAVKALEKNGDQNARVLAQSKSGHLLIAI
jgi:hypothetical protein